MFVCWLTRWSSKRRQGRPLNPKPRNLTPGTTLLTKGVPIPIPSHKIHPLPFQKEPQLHKRSKLLKMGLIPIP